MRGGPCSHRESSLATESGGDESRATCSEQLDLTRKRTQWRTLVTGSQKPRPCDISGASGPSRSAITCYGM